MSAFPRGYAALTKDNEKGRRTCVAAALIGIVEFGLFTSIASTHKQSRPARDARYHQLSGNGTMHAAKHKDSRRHVKQFQPPLFRLPGGLFESRRRKRRKIQAGAWQARGKLHTIGKCPNSRFTAN